MLLLALDDVGVRTESVDCPWSVPIIRARNKLEEHVGYVDQVLWGYPVHLHKAVYNGALFVKLLVVS
jgi:hypothetical protein